ncbi:hypothetical protein VHEMI01938 [[Torrubiella] hemipterigena]|uniref:Cytochrome P450 n=1 Tax=[Torrubiella] hemipterigena TaxID=1531966 RepID=A0A0A1SN74_9HYPO|nr:hypothetical protein VHEMI01938 [[Torrubiella] hemipterigena]
MLSFSSIVGLAVTGSVAFVIWKAYPKPIAGVPYHKKSARSILGDIPRLSQSLKKTQDFVKYIVDEAEVFQGPIFQLFLSPFSSPTIVIVDYEETRDIMLHRTGEFDRSKRVQEVFRPIIGTNQFVLDSGETWKLHRRLVQDTMSPAFLRDVAAPSLYKAFQVLVDLWDRKIALASGRPFPVGEDISAATLDGVLAFTFGSNLSNTATMPRLEALTSLDPKSWVESLHQDAPVDFPTNRTHPSIEAVGGISHYLAKVSEYPVPNMAWWFFKRTSHFQQQSKLKKEFIHSKIEKSIHATAGKADGTTVLRNAVDLVIDRERRLSERYGKTPDYFSDAVVDELFGFTLAGHETTSTTMAWVMKILTSHPSIQLKLRRLL